MDLFQPNQHEQPTSFTDYQAEIVNFDLSEFLPLAPAGAEWDYSFSAPDPFPERFPLITETPVEEENNIPKDAMPVPHFEISWESSEVINALFSGQLSFDHHTYFLTKTADNLHDPANNMFGIHAELEIKSNRRDVFAIINHSAPSWDFKEMPFAPNNTAYVQIGHKKGTKFVHRVSNNTRKRIFAKTQMKPPYDWSYYFSCPARDRQGPIDHLWKKEIEKGFYFVYIFIPAQFVQPPSKEYSEPPRSKRIRRQDLPPPLTVQTTQPSPALQPATQYSQISTPVPSPTQFSNAQLVTPYFYPPLSPILTVRMPPLSSPPPPLYSPPSFTVPPSPGLDPTTLTLWQHLRVIQSAQLSVMQLLNQNPQLHQDKVRAELQDIQNSAQTCLSLISLPNSNQ